MSPHAPNPNQEDPSAFNWQGTRVNADDFAAGEDEGSTISAGSTPKEVLEAEVGDDNGVGSALASYRRVRPGGRGSNAGRSGEGKLYVSLQGDQDGDGTVEQVDQRTQMRLIKRPKNGDERTPLTRWFVQRDLDRDDPRQRIPLEPVTNSETGNPLVVREGDVLAVEVRNNATDITVSKADSVVEFPAQVGY